MAAESANSQAQSLNVASSAEETVLAQIKDLLADDQYSLAEAVYSKQNQCIVVEAHAITSDILTLAWENGLEVDIQHTCPDSVVFALK